MFAGVGSIIGGTIAIFLLGLLAGRVLFRRNAPLPRTLKSIAVAFVIAAILAGFGFANGAGFAPLAGLRYVLPALIAFAILLRHYRVKDKGAEIDVFR